MGFCARTTNRPQSPTKSVKWLSWIKTDATSPVFGAGGCIDFASIVPAHRALVKFTDRSMSHAGACHV